MIIEDRYFRS